MTLDAEDHDHFVQLIMLLASLNPGGDPRGVIDPEYTAACAAFDPDRKTETPLLLEEWKALRESGDYTAAFSRNILDAVHPAVFLVVLRDRMVHTAGCVDPVIGLISDVVDRFVDTHHMVWKDDAWVEATSVEVTTESGSSVQETAAALPSAEKLKDLSPRRALDLLFQTTDDALWAGHHAGGDWSHLDAWLGNLDPAGMPTQLIVGVLSALYPMRGSSWYSTWFYRARTVLLERESPVRVNRLLMGFQPPEEKEAR